MTEPSAPSEAEKRNYRLVVEYKSLEAYIPSGMYVLPQLGNICIWHGVLFVRHGLYKDARFRFKLQIPAGYPAKPPIVFFLSKVYHPLVHPETGELALTPQFPQWRPQQDFLFKVLAYIHKVFHSQECWLMVRHGLNPDALYLLSQDEEAFAQEVRQCVCASQRPAPEDHHPANPVEFGQFNAFHKIVRDAFQASAAADDSGEAFMQWFSETFTEEA